MSLAQHEKDAALVDAAAIGSVADTQKWLSMGAKPGAVDEFGFSALFMAAKSATNGSPYLQVVDTLLNHGTAKDTPERAGERIDSRIVDRTLHGLKVAFGSGEYAVKKDQFTAVVARLETHLQQYPIVWPTKPFPKRPAILGPAPL